MVVASGIVKDKDKILTKTMTKTKTLTKTKTKAVHTPDRVSSGGL